MIALKYGDNKSIWHSIKLICIYLILYIAFIPGGAYAIQAAGEINVKSLETLIKNR